MVVNQNGVAYPAWAGSDTERLNARLRNVLQAATHVVYQGDFCKQAADEFLGPPAGFVGDPAERRRHGRVHSGRAPAGGRPTAAAGRRPVAGVPTGDGARDAGTAARGAAARDRLGGRRPAADRRARPRRPRRLRRALRPARRTRALPPGARAAPSQGARPLSQRRAGGTRLRRARRPLGERRRAGAGGGCRHRRVFGDDLGARRAARACRARRGGANSARFARTPIGSEPVRGPSSTSTSRPGWSGTGRCSRSSWNDAARQRRDAGTGRRAVPPRGARFHAGADAGRPRADRRRRRLHRRDSHDPRGGGASAIRASACSGRSRAA